MPNNEEERRKLACKSELACLICNKCKVGITAHAMGYCDEPLSTADRVIKYYEPIIQQAKKDEQDWITKLLDSRGLIVARDIILAEISGVVFPGKGETK